VGLWGRQRIESALQATCERKASAVRRYCPCGAGGLVDGRTPEHTPQVCVDAESQLHALREQRAGNQFSSVKIRNLGQALEKRNYFTL
jgi:hypothetical protein